MCFWDEYELKWVLIMAFISGFILPTQQRKDAQRHKGNVIYFWLILAFVRLNERLDRIDWFNCTQMARKSWVTAHKPTSCYIYQQIKSLPGVVFSKNVCFTLQWKTVVFHKADQWLF